MRESYDYNSITPGKLTDITDIKILICYILFGVNSPMSKENIIQILCENELADYFDASTAIADLIDNHSLAQTEDGMIRITGKGRNAASELEISLPLSVREKATAQAIKLLARSKTESENEVNIEKCDNGYYVNCKMTDGKDEMFNLRLYVSDDLQAQKVKEKFLDDPAQLYLTIVNGLLK